MNYDDSVMVPRCLLKLLGKNIYDTYQTYGWWARYDDDDEWISANMVTNDVGGAWDLFSQVAPGIAVEVKKEYKHDD